jgi:hypothetical protein
MIDDTSSDDFTLGLIVPTHRSRLLQVVSGFMLFGAISSLVLVFSPVSQPHGLGFQALLACSSLVTGIAAVGVWRRKQWGVALYVLLFVVTQPLMAMGLWTWAVPIVPGIVILLLALKVRAMSPLIAKQTQ